jgi:uncharacterized protein YabN with tetrapyrrole methylase and pyrophosphatase domain
VTRKIIIRWLLYGKLQVQKKRERRNKPTTRWKKCKPVRKKKQDEYTESLRDIPKVLNSLICKEMKVQAKINDIKEKGIQVLDEISKDTNTPPKDTAALERLLIILRNALV